MTESLVVSIMLEAMRVTTLLSAPLLLGIKTVGPIGTVPNWMPEHMVSTQ